MKGVTAKNEPPKVSKHFLWSSVLKEKFLERKSVNSQKLLIVTEVVHMSIGFP